MKTATKPKKYHDDIGNFQNTLSVFEVFFELLLVGAFEAAINKRNYTPLLGIPRQFLQFNQFFIILKPGRTRKTIVEKVDIIESKYLSYNLWCYVEILGTGKSRI